MTSPLKTIKEESNNCFMCDNYLFDDKYYKADSSNDKIKLCSRLCFEKYTIAVQQRQFKSRKTKAEKKEKS